MRWGACVVVRSSRMMVMMGSFARGVMWRVDMAHACHAGGECGGEVEWGDGTAGVSCAWQRGGGGGGGYMTHVGMKLIPSTATTMRAAQPRARLPWCPFEACRRRPTRPPFPPGRRAVAGPHATPCCRRRPGTRKLLGRWPRVRAPTPSAAGFPPINPVARATGRVLCSGKCVASYYGGLLLPARLIRLLSG